jgi:hypothetical protein
MILAAVAADASAETFTELMDRVARGFEALGAAILVVGVIWSFVLAAVAWRRSGRSAKALWGIASGIWRDPATRAGNPGRRRPDSHRCGRPYSRQCPRAWADRGDQDVLSFSLETEIAGVAPWRRALISGAGPIRRASANALESETPR